MISLAPAEVLGYCRGLSLLFGTPTVARSAKLALRAFALNIDRAAEGTAGFELQSRARGVSWRS
jgi:hypothetical protein